MLPQILPDSGGRPTRIEAEVTKVTPEEIRALSVDGLLHLRRQVEDELARRREELQQQLERITGTHDHPMQAARKTNKGQASPPPRYRSRKNPDLVWSGRGVLPRWMREEMKGTKLTKPDFKIPRE